MHLTCDNDRIIVNGDSIRLDDLSGVEAFQYTDTLAEKYYTSGIFDNELFLYFIQSYLILERYIIDQALESVDVSNADSRLNLFLSDIAKRHDIPLRNASGLSSLLIDTRAYLDLWASFGVLVLMVIRIPFKSGISVQKEFSIVRSPQTKRRIEALDIDFIYEDPFDKTSIYSRFKRTKRLTWTFNALKAALKAMRELVAGAKEHMGSGSSSLVRQFYGRRLVHTFLYENMVGEVFSDKGGSIFYTGNNLDRFGLIEENLCRELRLKLVVLPHGLEYGFKMPKGFTGDIFYTTSKLAAERLNALYGVDKFIFDQKKFDLFFRNKPLTINEAAPRLIFFTEPREVEVNLRILDELLPLLQEKGVELFLKLHPKDSHGTYASYDVSFIDDTKEALAHNVCFARKSTTLLEAVANGSSAAAIIVNPRDKAIFNTFISLQIREIEQCFSINSLRDWAMVELNAKKLETSRN